MASLSEREMLSVEMLGALTAQLQEGQVMRRVGFTGYSMLPMLRQGRDCVDLVKVPEHLGKYDLPLYIGPRGKYVMHRIIAVEDHCCICLGDNTYSRERVQREHIVAVVCAFYRGNRRIPVTAWHYRVYCRVWTALFPLRKAVRDFKKWLRRHLK